MKRFIIFAALLGVTGIASAFILVTGFEFEPNPPPRSMLDAYAMAARALGSATNDYYCVDVKRSHDWCYAGEWVFTFDKNSMQHKQVFVAMKPYESFNPDIQLKPWPLTEVRDTGVIMNATNTTTGK